MAGIPLFHSDLATFKQLLPTSPNAETTPKCKLLLDSYLHHYGIDFVQQSLTSKHTVWQTNIAGYTIVQHCWKSDNAKKTLIINHGYFDHTGLYGQLIAWGLNNHYRVISYDMPGHGLSSGEPAAIDSFDTYSQVLEEVIVQAVGFSASNNHLPAPVIDLVGQSTGCAVIANYLLKHPHPSVSQVVLLAPLVRSMGWQTMRWIYFICKRFLSSVKRKFINSSHNTRFNHFLQYDDPLQAREIPLSWLGAMEDWYQYIHTLPASQTSSQPLIIIQGSGDMTVDWHHNLPALRRCFPNTLVHMIPKARHHLVKETPKFWDQVANHLESINQQSTPYHKP